MFIKKPSHRKFDYQPRHYDPKQDKVEKRKRKLGFSSKTKRGNKNLPIAYIIMLLVILYLFLKFNGYI